jgi:glucose-1-phosphate thymidylyltransferase
VQIAKELNPSTRGELEITDINRVYLQNNLLHVEVLGRGFAWLDTGTFDSLAQATQFIETIQNRQGFKVACPEEIAYYMNYISRDELLLLGEKIHKNDYGKYLIEIANSNSRPLWGK